MACIPNNTSIVQYVDSYPNQQLRFHDMVADVSFSAA